MTLVGDVVLVEIDAVGAQPLQRRFAPPCGCTRASRAPRAVAHVAAELRREHDPVAPPFEHLAEERLAAALVAVDVRRVEQRDAGVERGVDDGARPLEVDAHAEVVAAEADDRDLGPIATQPTRTHGQDGKLRRCATAGLGSSDLDVSEISLGSWLTYGGGVEREQAEACVAKAFEVGINFIDTANVYARGAPRRSSAKCSPAARATPTSSRRSSTSR